MRLTRRQRVLLGALGLAATVWLIDALAGSGGPRPAAGNPAAAPVAGPNGPVARWQSAGDEVARLVQHRYEPLAEDAAVWARDLFQPTPAMERALGPATPPAEPAAAAPGPPSEPPRPGFAERHRLLGVMLGDVPVAVVDGRLLVPNSDLDGFVLVDVQRDYVVFERRADGERVRLELESPLSGG